LSRILKQEEKVNGAGAERNWL